MSNLTRFPDLEAAREAAALWIVRQDRGLTAAETTELQQWLLAPANRRAFHDMGGVWNRMEVMSVLADVFPRPRAPRLQRALPWALGAATACALAIATVLLLPRPAPNPATPARVQAFASAIGEQRTIALRDGSSLVLNTNSLVEVAFTDHTRRLQLQRGEAHFDVAHDVARPFVVGVGNHDVRAVGTAFNIRLHDDRSTDVLVTDGTISVREVGATTKEATVTSGHLLRMRADGSRAITSVDAPAISAQLAWRRNELVFDGETLGVALQEVSRYTARPVRLADSALNSRRIAGFFPSDDLPALLQSLQANFGLVATETDTEIRLSAGAVTRPE